MKWMLCVTNKGYEASLEARKLYSTLNDEKAESRGFVRVVDESGEDYLYPREMFASLELSAPVEQKLLAVA